MADTAPNDLITPLPDLNACPSCFLFQARGGTTCPPMRPAYDLERERRLQAALRVDASAGRPTFADLVRRDAGAVVGTKPVLALMPGATTEVFPNMKEAHLVQQKHARSSR